MRPALIVSKNLKLEKLAGKVYLRDKSIASIQIGFGYVGIIDSKYKRSLWENSGEIYFNGKCRLNVGSKIVCAGRLELGNNFVINGNSDIICMNDISIGENVLISWECLIMDTDFHGIYDIETRKLLNPNKDVIIGNNVWVGCRTTLLKGTNIPNGSVIGSNSFVNKKLVNENCVYRNDKVIKTNVEWKYKLNP